jgi:fatty-acyl-CoA synthase
MSTETSVTPGLEEELETWPATLAGFPGEVARRYGDDTALVTEAERCTFRELEAGARDVARALIAHDLEPGARVGVVLPNGPRWAAAVFGVAMAGGVPVLLNVFSSVQEQDAALAVTGARALCIADPLLDTFLGSGALRSPVAALELIVSESGGDHGPCRTWPDFIAAGGATPQSSVDDRITAIGPQDDSFIMFTSGTSGVSKGVLHRQSSPVRQFLVWRRMQELRRDDRIFTTYPFCWSAGLCRCLGAALASGARTVTLGHFGPAAALALMASEQATAVITPNEGHLDHRLIEHVDFRPDALRSVRRASNPVLATALGLGRRWLPRGYGMTETLTLVTGAPVSQAEDLPAGATGRPLPGWDVRVVDEASGADVAVGEVGRIKLRGQTLMTGYVGRSAAETFDADGYFLTSDLGYLDADGYLYFSGRADDLVRSAGVNVSAAELERELGQHPQVRLVVALGVPHPRLGQALVACIVRENVAPEAPLEAPPEAPLDAPLDGDQIAQWLRPRLATYKQPRAVLFFEESELSFTASQKVERAPLRERVLRRIEQEGLW